jgi:hypothetical protein
MTMSGDNVASFTNLGTAGGTATAAGPNDVPRVDDYFGPGRHAVFNTAAVRASFHLALTLSSKAGVTLVTLGRATGNASPRYTVSWGTSGTHQAYQVVLGSTSEIVGFHRTNAGLSARYTGRSWVGPAVTVTTHNIAGAGGLECFATVNGESRDLGNGGYTSNNTTNFDGAGTFKFLDNAASASPVLGHWHACLMFDRILTTEEIAIVSDWGREQLGIEAGQPAGIYMPTGLWEGGIGITLNTTPDPDQISAWADQSGYGRNLTQITTGAQPLAELWISPDTYVPRFVGEETGGRRLAGAAISAFLTSSTFTLMAVIRPGAGMPSAASVVRRSAAVFGEGNGIMSLVCYRTAGQSYVLGHASNILTPEIAIADDVTCFVAMRLSGGTLTLLHSASPASSLTTQSVGSVPDLSIMNAALRTGSIADGTNFRVLDAVYFEGVAFSVAISDDDLEKIKDYQLTRYAA